MYHLSFNLFKYPLLNYLYIPIVIGYPPAAAQL